MEKKKTIAVLTGAGMSVESGLKTFRNSDGLWAENRIEDVCTPEALEKNPQFVFGFYNRLRKEYMQKEPHSGHFGLVELEKKYKVNVITQNVDNLHERAGSSHVLHLHGEINKARSYVHPGHIYDLKGEDLNYGDTGEDGTLLRPHIVFFGESVPNIEPAIDLVKESDIMVIIGTSMVVYPAAGLLMYAPKGIPVYIIDPEIPQVSTDYNITKIAKGASQGIKDLLEILM